MNMKPKRSKLDGKTCFLQAVLDAARYCGVRLLDRDVVWIVETIAKGGGFGSHTGNVRKFMERFSASFGRILYFKTTEAQTAAYSIPEGCPLIIASNELKHAWFTVAVPEMGPTFHIPPGETRFYIILFPDHARRWELLMPPYYEWKIERKKTRKPKRARAAAKGQRK